MAAAAAVGETKEVSALLGGAVEGTPGPMKSLKRPSNLGQRHL